MADVLAFPRKVVPVDEAERRRANVISVARLHGQETARKCERAADRAEPTLPLELYSLLEELKDLLSIHYGSEIKSGSAEAAEIDRDIMQGAKEGLGEWAERLFNLPPHLSICIYFDVKTAGYRHRVDVLDGSGERELASFDTEDEAEAFVTKWLAENDQKPRGDAA